MTNQGKKENSLEKIISAVKSIIDQFEGRTPPSIISLKNYDGFENFKEVLERQLSLRGYKITSVINSNDNLKENLGNKKKTDYTIDVINYLNQDNYPGRLM